MTFPLEQLRTVFVESMALEAGTDVDNAQYSITPGWDSIAHMALVAELEDQFDVMLDTDDVIDMSSFTKIVEILGKYDVAFE